MAAPLNCSGDGSSPNKTGLNQKNKDIKHIWLNIIDKEFCKLIYSFLCPYEKLFIMNKSIESFIAYLRLEKNCSEHTIDNYVRDINQFLEYSFGEVNDISFTKIDSIQARSFLVNVQKSGASSKTTARKLSALRSFSVFG